MDRFIQHALSQSVHALAPLWLPALEAGRIRFEHPDDLVFVLRAHGGEAVASQVRELLAAPRLDPDTAGSLLGLLAEVGAPDDLRHALDQAAAHPEVLTALSQSFRIHQRKPTGDLAAALNPLIEHPSAEVRSGALRLAGDWKLRELEATIQNILDDPDAPAPARGAAVESLAVLQGRAALPAVTRTAHDPDPRLWQPALQALCKIKLPAAAEVAAALLRADAGQDRVRGIVTPFLGHHDGPEALAAALGRKPLAPETADRIRAVLAAAGRHEPALARVLGGASPSPKDAVGLPKYSEPYVAALAAEIRADGDAAAGAKTYTAAALSCVACHKIGETGGILGPDLSTVGAGVPIELLIEAVLWPKRQIKEGYIATTVTTKDGAVLSGYLEKQDETRLLIRDAATGTTTAVPSRDIEKRHDAGTLMPPGLTATLTRNELRDLIRYLSELKGK